MPAFFRPTLLAAACLLAACHSTTVDTAPQTVLPAAFEHAGNSTGAADISQWWQNWHDPVLNWLIEQALSGNYDIQTAQSRLREAQATARLARADLLPQAGLAAQAATADGQIDNPLPAAVRPLAGGERLDVDGRVQTLGLSASWEPDVFGKKRSDADAARAGALVQEQQLYGARLLAAADLADHYFQARALQRNRSASAAVIDNLQRMQRYARGRFQAGHVSKYEVHEAEAALQSAQARHQTLEAQLDAHIRAIAVLSGQVPQGFRLPESSADVLAATVAAPSGATPQGLLERRPDLRARAAAVQARAAGLASAKADLYPRFAINFLGQGGRIDIDGSDALKGWGSLIGVSLSVPLFTGGRIKHNIAAADARLQTALLEYDQNLITALSEVDNAYQAYGSLNRQSEQLAQALKLQRQRADDAGKLFAAGEKTLDAAIRARLDQHQAEEHLTQAQLARAQALLGIYKALGGGW